MSHPDKNINPGQIEPTLGDILQLQATIEALPDIGLRELSDTERICITRYPTGQKYGEDTAISHVCLSQQVGTKGGFAAVMNYVILRNGDETTTRLIKRSPFEIGINTDPTDVRAVKQELGRATMALEDYDTARQMGIYDLTADEVHTLTNTIQMAYRPKD